MSTSKEKSKERTYVTYRCALHHLLRIIDEIKPRFLAIENVASGAKRWLPRVVQELIDRGYRPRAVPLGAVDVGAPHRRLRVFVVADRDGAASRRLGGVRDGERATLGDDAGGCGEGLVADGQREGLEVERVEQARRQLAPAERGGGALPDAERGQLRQQPWRRSGARGSGEGVAREHGAELADAAESGRAGTDGSERQGRPVEPERRGDAWSDVGSPQSGVGGDSHGLPVDVAGHTFPAGRGAEQYPWEAPRAIRGDVKVPDRPAKLRALGNAVVPQCGLVVGRILVAMGA
jgi:DNA (cytosine-5)-methyltransferase 1